MIDKTMFPVELERILERMRAIHPLKYGKTRNYTDGSVSRLSPYLSRGVLSLREVANFLLEKYPHDAVLPFFRELCWRSYFQRVWESKGDAIFSDLKQAQQHVHHHGLPLALMKAETDITAIDEAIRDFYETGYLHNHVRMYIASLTCQVGHAHWYQPAQWMYYHLLDGDPASNMLSWQWVAGSFSSKPYRMNQDNVNQYTRSKQMNTYLDVAYEKLPDMDIPDCWKENMEWAEKTTLPETEMDMTTETEDIFIYNSFNLNPRWHSGEKGKRVLLLEPSHFEKHPVSEKVMAFILNLSKQIPGMEYYSQDFDSLKTLYPNARFHFNDHPTTQHYSGNREKNDLLFPTVTGYFPSFSAYWKKVEPLYYRNQF